jgi:general secretion pathway protein D
MQLNKPIERGNRTARCVGQFCATYGILLVTLLSLINPVFSQEIRPKTTRADRIAGGEDSQVRTVPLVRTEIAANANQWLAMRQAMVGAYGAQSHPHPAKPDALLLQFNNDFVLMEHDAARRVIRIEGLEPIVVALNRVGLAYTRESTVSKDRSFRFVSLKVQGQQALRGWSQQELTQRRGFGVDGPVRLAGGFQDPNLQSGPEPIGASQKDQDAEKDGAPDKLPLPQFEGVQIEMLPDLDAVILRGRDQQLTDLSEIIKRLDQASKESKPEIEVVTLQHVNSESLAKIIEDIEEKFLGARQGRVTVAPLISPNALLLIGWGESMELMKQLIMRLDQPTRSDSTLAVFPLKHALASEVQSDLQSFYKGKDGLAPIINSFADPRSNAIIVNGSPRDIEEIRKLLDKLDVPQSGLMQSARVFQIRHSIASDIAEALQEALATTTSDRNRTLQIVDENGNPIVSGGILGATKITVNDRNNTLIVSSSPETLPLIERFIEQLDTPGATAKIKIFPVKNGDAASLVETLRALIPSSSATTAGSGTAAVQLSSNPSEMSLLPLRFTVDTRGNNIIAIGSDGDLKIVEALILRLDEGDLSQRKSMVYQLKNSPAIDVATAINQFLQNKRVVELAAPGTNNPFDQLDREVVVVPEPVQNKLILSATPRYYDEIAKLIERLDEQPPQVMIQVMIAEISLGNTDEFGVEWGLQDSVLFDRSLLGDLATRTTTTNTSTPAGVVTQTTQEIVAASNVPGFNFNNIDPLGNSGSAKALNSSNSVGGQGISNFAVGRGNDELGFGGLVLSASSENVSFLLRALQDSRRLEILSRPQVLTLDNQQAFIQVGQRIPRIVNSIINQNGTQNVVALENVGLIIGVTPRISPEGNVVMEIDAEKSKLGPEDEGIPISIAQNGTVIRSPRVDTITAQATVSAADGETIILGGLISRSTRTNHRQVPWLGDIPVIKYLFSYDYSDTVRTELLIIMTPHIVRNPTDMERLKQAEFARMSWCEADVFEIHGDVFPRTGMLQDWNEDPADCPVVYPDSDPRGSYESTLEIRNPSMPQELGTQLPSSMPDSFVPPVQGVNELPTPTSVKPSAGLLRLPRTLPPSVRPAPTLEPVASTSSAMAPASDSSSRTRK